jgi:hypothetical protein
MLSVCFSPSNQGVQNKFLPLKTRIKINKAKAMFTGRSLKHSQATTAGHSGGKPKPEVDLENYERRRGTKYK